jgi:hypothetical protein
MTQACFGAPAPSTPPRTFARPAHAVSGAVGFRIVRIVWLTARFLRREPVRIEDYCRRFGMSLRSFHRDVDVLRDAGFEIERCTTRTYRMLCFTYDSDCA